MPAHPSPPDDQGLHARDLWTVGGLLAAATAAALLLDPYVTLTSQAMLYVLAVVLAAYTRGRAASLLCVAAAVMLLNFLFVPPRYTFRVDAQENVFALVALLGFMLPVIWIPPQHDEWMQLLRHVQTASFNWGLFLMCAGLLILLEDLIQHSAADD